jgi:transposase-like protein
MNDHVTISTFQLFALFPDQEAARKYLESRLWPNGVICPTCHSGERITTRVHGFYRCNACQLDFTVRTGTIFERSHVPLHKWLYAMYLMVTARKGISSLQLSKEIGVTQKSAWFMLQRLREACGKEIEKLRGTVEIDETFIGGLEINKHEAKKLKEGRGAVGKAAVLGMRERDGKTIALPVNELSQGNVESLIHKNIEVGSKLMTDEHACYTDLNGLFFDHSSVNHSAGEYARGAVHTNSIESVWAVLKRGLNGVYHHVSKKHLGRYVDEFAFRLNDGNVERHTLRRLDSFVDAIVGKRITYQELIA